MEKAICSRIDVYESALFAEYYACIEDLLEHTVVLAMKNFTQHGNTSCFQHCINVSYYNFRICRLLRLNFRAAARAGILHDLYLYDWHLHKRQKGEPMHGFYHPKIALQNAELHFELNDCERDMILKHMFPLTVSFPKYRETFVIIIVDKYCAVLETIVPKILLMKKIIKKILKAKTSESL